MQRSPCKRGLSPLVYCTMFGHRVPLASIYTQAGPFFPSPLDPVGLQPDLGYG